MRATAFFCICLLLAGTAAPGGKSIAQQPPVPTLLFNHLRTEDGLNSNNIWALVQDSIGYLWAGGENGLTRFDGLHCESYQHTPGKRETLTGSNVHHLLATRGGNLWVGTQSGLSYYRRAGNNFLSFHFKGTGNNPLQPQYVFPFFEDDRTQLWLYLGAGGMVAAWNLLTGRVKNISSLSDGYLFASQPTRTPLRRFITRLQRGIMVSWLSADTVVEKKPFFTGAEAGLPASFIDQVVTESDTLLWLCADAGLIALNPNTGQHKIFSRFRGRPVDANCAVVLNNRFLGVGTAGEGLLLFDKVQGAFTKQYRHFAGDPRSLAGNTVYRSLLDKNGNLFLSIANHGIDYAPLWGAVFALALNGEEAAQVGISGNLTAVCPLPAGNILCGTDEETLVAYDPGGKTPPQKFFCEGKTESLTPLPGGSVLVQSSKGFLQYRPGGPLQKLQLQLPAGGNGTRLVQHFTYLPGGQLIAATTEGLMKVQLRGKVLSFEPYKQVNAATEWANFQFVAALSDSQVLLQSYATNLYLLRAKNDTLQVLKEVARTPFRTYGMALAGNTAYLATTTGLRRYLIAEQRLEEAPEGITTACQGILKTDAHTLWVSATDGLYRFDTRSRHATRFGTEEGLQEALFNPGALVRLPNGKGAAGGLGGLTIFNPAVSTPVPNAVPATLREVLVNDVPAAGGGNPEMLRSLELDYNQNSLSFSFGTIDFTAPGQNPISYQLVGYDDHALTALGGATVRYGQLPPGSYRFAVSASGSTHLLGISIAPPWWQTGWARGGAAGLLAGLVATAFALRLRFVRREARARLALTIRSGEEERRRIARDLHDDFGARLSTLKLYLLSAGKDPALLTASAGLIDGAIVELRRILRNLSPRALEENGLQAAVADLAQSINQTGVLHCEADMKAFPQRLAPRTEYALYRVVQELVGNTLKHAGASRIFISFVVRGALLVILYEDNGKGFVTGGTSAGYGLQNIQTHVESVGGTLVLDAAPGRGIAVTIEVPLRKTNLP